MLDGQEAADEQDALHDKEPQLPSRPRRGRPRKAERAFTDRQIVRDVLTLMETEIEMRLDGKARKIPVIVGVYWKMLQRALEGEPRMILEAIKLREQAVARHREHNPEKIAALEEGERKAGFSSPRGISDEEWEFLNFFRSLSRES